MRARAAMYVCVHSHSQGPSVFLKWSLRANRGGGSSDENRDLRSNDATAMRTSLTCKK